LNALRHNLNVYAQHLQPGVKMMAMVKASAYGSGSAEVAKLLEYQKIDYLSVAYTDEGVTLRKEGIKTPILVLNPDEASLELMRQYDLEPEWYNLSLIPKGGTIELSDLKGVHLKLDTGMHRLGFAPQDIPALIAYLKAHPRIKVKSIFSHLAASEAPEHDAFTALQFERFTTMYEEIATAIGYRPLRHIANTGGIVRSPHYHLDMVRLGIGLYGIDSSQMVQGQLQVVNTLKATISQIKELEVGETVGYSRRGVVNTPKRTATISIGYADGLSRAAGNGNYSVWVRGELAPIIGSVCMDMTMLDITHIAAAQEGDEVIIFGTTPSVQTFATAINTIPYEIFTGISERVKRVYFQ
jgi:Alr-MurF fusion protein